MRPGDTLTAIAAALGVPGGWQALYAANKAVIGPNPNLVSAGTVLAVPGATPPARYTVAPGDTLSAIAAALGVPGGWQALYAANKAVIGPDPDVIQAGTALAAPRPPAPAATAPTGTAPATAPARGHTPAGTAPHPVTPAASHQARGQLISPRPASPQAAPGSLPAATARPAAPAHPAASAQLAPGRASAPGTVPGGMPRWLLDVLLAAGVLAATAFAAEPAAALARRRRARPARRPARAAHPAAPRGAAAAPPEGQDHPRRPRKAHRHLQRPDHAVYILTPPGEDPAAVLRAARLILPEDTYRN